VKTQSHGEHAMETIATRRRYVTEPLVFSVTPTSLAMRKSGSTQARASPKLQEQIAVTTETKTTHTLNDLIEIARDGKDFYTEAAGKVKDAELSALFTRIAGVKDELVRSLSATVVAAGGKPADHGTVVGSMQQFYGKVRATLGDTQYGYVAELEESEDRLLKAFKDTLTDSDTTPAARQEVQRLLPQVQECHAVMRDRKHAMKH
jgi:uncharacterized protein (TIGR02284 family)